MYSAATSVYQRWKTFSNFITAISLFFSHTLLGRMTPTETQTNEIVIDELQTLDGRVTRVSARETAENIAGFKSGTNLL